MLEKQGQPDSIDHGGYCSLNPFQPEWKQGKEKNILKVELEESS
jgi:hypothetical protein